MSLFLKIKNRVKYYTDLYFRMNKYKSNVLLEFDASIFKDKRIALVGGADSVLKEKNGDYIDGFDVVVRTNKGVEVIDTQFEFVGKRTDVLFHFFKEGVRKGDSPITPQLWKEKGVKHLIFGLNVYCSSFALSLVKAFIEKTAGKIKFSQIPKSIFKANAKLLNPYPPTIGFVAINTIMACKPKELYITGVTFFKTPHNAAYRKGDLDFYKRQFLVEKIHDSDREYEFVKNLYLKNPTCIIPDRVLKEIFETN